MEETEFKVEMIDINLLQPHPKNYRQHPEDQLAHLCQSITEHGIYRNIITTEGLTILAGHGVWLACKKLNKTHVPVISLPLEPDSVQAIKILTADNEIAHLGEVDDRALTDLLKFVMDNDSLLGSGYDEKMLANLVFVTRPASEIETSDSAKEWTGMPEFERSPQPLKTIVQFDSDEIRRQFYKLLGIDAPLSDKKVDSIWFPPKEREELVRLKIKDEISEVTNDAVSLE